MSGPVVYTETNHGVVTIVINRPDKRNAFDRKTANAQRQTFTDFEANDALAAEGAGGYPVVFEEAIEGADRLVGGAGRHGAFDSPDNPDKPTNDNNKKEL